MRTETDRNTREDRFMNSEGSTHSVAPQGYTAVTPWIIGQDTVGLIGYLKQAFDAVELARIGEPGNIGHAEVRIGDAVVMMFDQPDWPPTPAFLRLYVADADETYRRALEAGGTSVTEVVHAPWGDRVCRVVDPFGNLWWIHARVEDVDDSDFARRMADPHWQAQMERLQSSLYRP